MNQFNATALSDQLENGRRTGYLEMKAGSLVFTDAVMNTNKLPINGIQMRIGGAGNRYIFFTHMSHPGLTFYTDDKNILKSPEIQFEPNLKQAVRQYNRRKNSVYIFFGVLVGLIITSIISLFVFRGNLVEHLANLIPPGTEQEISKTMKASALAGKDIVKDSLIMLQLESITKPLIKAVDDTAFHFNFTIIKDTTLNAFALPGGSVIIHSGLIEKANSAEEVAGVLAHEISHVTRRHHLRGMLGNMGIFFIIRGLLGDIAGISSDIVTAGATLSVLKYSRDFEREADDNGFQLLEKAKINPQGMISFFETMGKQGGDLGMANFLSTHPATDERIKRLREKKQIQTQYQNIPIAFDEFKNNINQYFKK